MRDDRFREGLEKLLATVLGAPATAEPRVRRAAAQRSADLPAELSRLVERIHRTPYKVTAEDLDALRSRYSEDQLFEIIAAAAVGASQQRYLAGMRAIDEASSAREGEHK